MADIEATVSIRDRLLKERHALLDLSSRNRLLNTPLRTRNNRAIEVVDEKAEEVFRLLTSNKAFTFLPGVALSDEERTQLDPEDNVTGGIPQPARHADAADAGRAGWFARNEQLAAGERRAGRWQRLPAAGVNLQGHCARQADALRHHARHVG